ncbi:MAG: hypothetical protein QOE18_844 [Chloroflexota bacterium]|nr:hypothetical protein [Chloroflexota bacterium]
MDPLARRRILGQAVAELLESETNGSLIVGVSRSDREPLIVTALGCNVLVGFGPRASLLVPMRALHERGTFGARALAAGCERTLRTVHGLPIGFVPTVCFDNPVNAAGWLRRSG